MSDYFTALGRSAGSVRQQRERTFTPGIVEQEVGRVSDAPNTARARASSQLDHPDSMRIGADISGDGGRPGGAPGVGARTSTQAAAGPQQRMSAPVGSTSQHRMSAPAGTVSTSAASPRSASAGLPEALVRNAVVNAALRWVAADPAGPRREAAQDQSSAREESGSLEAERAWIEMETASVAARHNTRRAAGERHETQRPGRGHILTADATVVDPLADEMPRLRDEISRLQDDIPGLQGEISRLRDGRPRIQEERVEVSIDTIQVRVDSPSPRAVVAPPMRASQSKVEGREDRSSNFSRCRVPRI